MVVSSVPSAVESTSGEVVDGVLEGESRVKPSVVPVVVVPSMSMAGRSAKSRFTWIWPRWKRGALPRNR